MKCGVDVVLEWVWEGGKWGKWGWGWVGVEVRVW